MSTQQEAPLVEAILEVRWGIPHRHDDIIEVKFDEEDMTLFAGIFTSKAESAFPLYKKVNELIPASVPHIVKHQFWTADNTWPCVQIGLGIMTVNQTNDGYSWSSFKSTCIKALEFLDQAHHKRLGGLSPIGIELKYQDGFPLEEGESDNDFLKNRAEITFGTPPAFLASSLLEPVIENHHIVFSVPVISPKAELLNRLDRGQIGAKPAFIQTTIVRSSDALCPEFSIVSLEKWLNDAHTVQKHAYETLVLPTYQRSK